MAQNNTFNHISDESKYTSFNPAGTKFPATVKTVQEALALTSPTSSATETAYGVVKIATMTQVLAGTDDTTAVTPLKLSQRLQHPDASTTTKGIISLATNAEALAGTVATKAIVPSSLKHVIDWNFANKTASETVLGVIKLSTESAAKAGVDNTTSMTPLRVKQAIAEATKLIPSYSTASEPVAGLVQLATAGQVQQGTLRAGVAVSPYALAQLTGNETRKGIVQAATLAQANAGTDKALYISAFGFKTFNASTTTFGTVKLSDVPGVAGAGIALSAAAKVVRLDAPAQTITGSLNVSSELTVNGKSVLTNEVIEDHMPVGAVMMWTSDTLPSTKWAICDGGQESKTTRPVLFQRIGYKFGGAADTFNRPDMRGLFVRGVGVGSAILNERGQDSKGKDKLGNGVTGGLVGSIQKQMQRKHKHALGDGDFNRSWFDYGASQKRGYGGGRNRMWDSAQEFTNDGTEIEPASARDDFGTLNTENFIGDENRPWNMSLYYIIKVA